MAEVWYDNNDHTLWVSDLHYIDPTDPIGLKKLYINDATITATIKDSADAVVAGPLTLSYITGSKGLYRGSGAHTEPLVVGTAYTITWIVNSPSGYAESTEELSVATRIT